jgi:MFS family permease
VNNLEPQQTNKPSVLTKRTLPIFGAFFFWGTGGGAQNLGRPLFAYALNPNIFFVTLILAFNAVAMLVASPITGFMSDRWGRKPLMITGASLRGITAFLEFFIDNYFQFLVLEFIGGIGIAMWMTSANILIADVTEQEVRGRVVALRGMSQRLGQVAGPLIGGILLIFFDIKTIFLFNGVTKIATLAVALFLIRESKPQSILKKQDSPKTISGETVRKLAPFMNKTFLFLVLATFAVSMMGQGVFQTLLPLFAKEFIDLSPTSIGTLLAMGGLVAVFVSFPNGMLSDKYGRKFSLVPGLFLLAGSAFLLSISQSYAGILAMVLLYGLAWGMSQSTSQVYAMDLAPKEGRGSFLGVWSLFQASGGFVAPLVVGALAQWWSFAGAFIVVAIWLVVSAILVALFAPETKPRNVG